MGLFGGLIRAISTGFSQAFSSHGRNSSPSKTSGHSRGGAGYGAWTFSNIMNSHCFPEDLVDEFSLDDEGCDYEIPWFGQSAYDQALQEARERAEDEASALEIEAEFDIDIDPEDLIDFELVEEKANEYAVEYAEILFDGNYWIDEDFLDWAYYDISDHNC